ncbi:MAG: efflux RND transporter periplasmic adaptor subunit [Nitrosomonadales bacterium]|nr:efflux RND transporter periplasmic adaptor subunit [Nitrosomonadales bacterium]
MTKKIAASFALLAVVMLSSYSFYRHIAPSWNEAQAAASVSAVAPVTPASTLSSINPSGQGKVWVCPMHPGIMQDHPGTCPICGMDLVESNNHDGHEHGVHVDTASLQKLGVRLASVKKSTLSREVRSYGNITVDGSAVYNIHSRFDGWIQKTYIHSVGQKIEQGQVIYEIYSPELVMQQKEYLRFAERRNQILQTITGDTVIFENEYVMNLLTELSNERSKFVYENVSPESIQKVEDSKMPLNVVKIVAEQSGVVTQINAREGTYVMPSAALFTLADVARIRVDVTLYPDQVAQVMAGDEVGIRIDDGLVIKAKLDHINPVAENNKVTARVLLDNAGRHLRPGTYVDVVIHAHPHEALTLPRSAVIYGGEGNMVMLSQGDGHFLPVPVETGAESGDRIEIVDGLQEGAEVAVNGQFLLDAASSMNASAERMHSGHHD